MAEDEGASGPKPASPPQAPLGPREEYTRNKYGAPAGSEEYRRKYFEENKERIREYHRRYQMRKRAKRDIERGYRRRPGRPLQHAEDAELFRNRSELPFAGDALPFGGSPDTEPADPLNEAATPVEGDEPVRDWVAEQAEALQMTIADFHKSVAERVNKKEEE